jgi:hypothetical protein
LIRKTRQPLISSIWLAYLHECTIDIKTAPRRVPAEKTSKFGLNVIV